MIISTGSACHTGGCNAKTIGLFEYSEPEIWKATHGFGTVLENVQMDEFGRLDLDDDSKTQNTQPGIEHVHLSCHLTPLDLGDLTLRAAHDRPPTAGPRGCPPVLALPRTAAVGLH